MARLRQFLIGTAASLLLAAAPARAETTLRLDVGPVGELDPAKASDFAASLLMFNAYDTLMAPTQGGAGMSPSLATGYKTDGNTIVFTLRDDVKFHSGNPLTADDVVFSFERLMAIGQGYSNLFAGRVEKIEAVDPHTVKFVLKESYAPFIPALVRLQILDSKLVKEKRADGKFGDLGDYGLAFLNAHDAGSGPYKVMSHDPQGETNFSVFDGYFASVPAKAPKQVRVRYGLEPSTVRTLVEKGEHDITSQWLPPEVLKALAKVKGTHFLSDRSGELYIKLNTQRAPLDDVHCRRALVKAFDYATAMKMVAIADGVSQASPATGALPQGMLGALDQAPFAQDLEAAKAELAQCRYTTPETRKLDISWITGVPVEERFALLMQASFQSIGFTSEIRGMPWALFTDAVTRPETTPHISQIFISASTPDPDSLLYNMYHSSAAGTWYSAEHLKDAEVDKLLDRGRSELDKDKRTAIYQELGRRLNELAPTIFAYDALAILAARGIVTAPGLSQDDKRFPLNIYGLAFRNIEMGQ